MGLLILNSLKNPLLGNRIDGTRPAWPVSFMLPALARIATIPADKQAMDGP